MDAFRNRRNLWQYYTKKIILHLTHESPRHYNYVFLERALNFYDASNLFQRGTGGTNELQSFMIGVICVSLNRKRA